jgi:capsule biosynthesis phosphatase
MYKDITLIFDIDGTICPIKEKDEKYEDIIPNKDIVEKMKEYKKNGAKITLYTSRNMNSYNGNIGLINANTAKILLKWLEKWEIPYDEIIYGKAWPGHRGVYVDDRSVRPDEFLNHSFEELEEICKKSSVKKEKN